MTMPDEYKAGDEIWVHPESWAVRQLPPDNKWWHEQEMVSYTRTDIVTALRDNIAVLNCASNTAGRLLKKQSAEIKTLREENERLRVALRFYGDKNNSKKHDGYVPGNWIEINGVLLFDPDNGQRAREALGEKNDPQ